MQNKIFNLLLHSSNYALVTLRFTIGKKKKNNALSYKFTALIIIIELKRNYF